MLLVIFGIRAFIQPQGTIRKKKKMSGRSLRTVTYVLYRVQSTFWVLPCYLDPDAARYLKNISNFIGFSTCLALVPHSNRAVLGIGNIGKTAYFAQFFFSPVIFYFP